MAARARTSHYASFAQFRKVLHLVYSALCCGLGAAAALFWMAIREMKPLDPETAARIDRSTLVTGAAVVSLLCVGVAAFLPQLATSRVPAADLALKMKSVLFSRILFAAAFEGGGLLWAVIALLLQDPRYLGGAVAALAVLVAFFPTTARIEEALGSTAEQVDRALGAAR